MDIRMHRLVHRLNCRRFDVILDVQAILTRHACGEFQNSKAISAKNRKLRRVFVLLDTDGDGLITEVRCPLACLGPPPCTKYLETSVCTCKEMHMCKTPWATCLQVCILLLAKHTRAIYLCICINAIVHDTVGHKSWRVHDGQRAGASFVSVQDSYFLGLSRCVWLSKHLPHLSDVSSWDKVHVNGADDHRHFESMPYSFEMTVWGISSVLQN